jgi:formylglycine-generating enzyme
MFEKLLQGFKIGDLPYSDFQYHLKRLLSTGAPAEDLMAVLRRREAIEPLPEYARDEVQGLLSAAIERTAENTVPPTSDAPLPTENPPAAAGTDQETAGPARSAMESKQYQAELLTARDALAARDASIGRLRRLLGEQDDQFAALEARVKVAAQLSGELNAERKRAAELAAELTNSRAALASEQGRSLELTKALSAQAESGEAARLRGEATQRQSEQYQAELRAARESLEFLSAKQREQEKSLPALESRAKIGAQLEADLQTSRMRAEALAADLAAAQAALEAEQKKSREFAEAQRDLERYQAELRSVHDALAAAQAALEAEQKKSRELAEAQRDLERYQAELRSVRDALAAREKTVDQVRHSLGERNAHLSAMQEDHGRIVSSLEARAKSAAADLQAARTRIESLVAELKTAREAAAALHAQRKRDESQLQALRAKLGATQTQSSSYLEILQTHDWRKGFDQNRFLESDTPMDEGAPTTAIGGLAVASGARQPEYDHVPEPVPGNALQAEPFEPPAKKAPSVRPARTAPGLRNRPWLRGSPWSSAAKARAIGAGVAIVALTAVAWLFFHLSSTRPTAPAVSAGAAPQPGSVIRDCPRCPAVTVLRTGRFIQGSDRPGNSSPFEKPLRWVAISHPIAMSTNAVTVDEFSAFVAATGRDMRGCDTYDGEWKHRPENSWENPAFVQTGSHPVTCVSWKDAKAYAEWLSSTTGHRYRLPSASEWEYASRGGGEAVVPWSSNAAGACESANVADQSAAGRYPGWVVYPCSDGYVYTAPVGSFKPNAFGLRDMLGNVFQWTEDCWYPDYVGAPVDGSARTTADCSEHEARGGSWFTNPAYVRADYRNHFDANYRTSSVGIRMVRDLAP